MNYPPTGLSSDGPHSFVFIISVILQTFELLRNSRISEQLINFTLRLALVRMELRVLIAPAVQLLDHRKIIAVIKTY